MNHSVESDLARFDQAFREAEVSEHQGPDLVPDGDYAARIEGVELKKRESSGALVLVWTLRVEGGEHAGRNLRKFRPITDRTIPYIKEDLTKCGLRLERLSDLPRHLDTLKGCGVEVTKRTRDGKSNVHIHWTSKSLTADSGTHVLPGGSRPAVAAAPREPVMRDRSVANRASAPADSLSRQSGAGSGPAGGSNRRTEYPSRPPVNSNYQGRR
jgi:hypothetical protein